MEDEADFVARLRTLGKRVFGSSDPRWVRKSLEIDRAIVDRLPVPDDADARRALIDLSES